MACAAGVTGAPPTTARRGTWEHGSKDIARTQGMNSLDTHEPVTPCDQRDQDTISDICHFWRYGGEIAFPFSEITSSGVPMKSLGWMTSV